MEQECLETQITVLKDKVKTHLAQGLDEAVGKPLGEFLAYLTDVGKPGLSGHMQKIELGIEALLLPKPNLVLATRLLESLRLYFRSPMKNSIIFFSTPLYMAIFGLFVSLVIGVSTAVYLNEKFGLFIDYAGRTQEYGSVQTKFNSENRSEEQLLDASDSDILDTDVDGNIGGNDELEIIESVEGLENLEEDEEPKYRHEESTNIFRALKNSLIKYNLDLDLLVIAGLLGAVGSIVSVAVRFKRFALREDITPQTIALSCALKPFVGMAFGIIVISLIESGVIDIWAVKPSENIYFTLVIAFICGFSERFARDVITKIDQPATEEKLQEIIDLQNGQSEDHLDTAE